MEFGSSRQLAELNAIYMESVAKTAGQKLEKMEKDDDAFGSPNKKGKKAKKDYDGDGKIESGTDEYMGSRDKAIKKAMSKEEYTVTNADKKGNTPAYQAYKAGKKNVKTGKPMYKAADHMKEGYGKGVKMADVPKGSKVGPKKVATPKGSKMKKGHDCATKVKHEHFGMGECIKEMHTLDQFGNVSHYDVMFGENVIKNVPVSHLEILEGMYHEHVVNDEKNKEVLDEKEGYKTVAAVIDYDRSKKGTDDATYDSMHGDKKGAKKERDYAAFERSKMKKDDPNWKHKKGSTSEEVDLSMHSPEILGYAEAYAKMYNEQNELATKEIKDLQKAAKTGKGKYVAKADKIADEFDPQALIDSGKFTAEEIAKVEEAMSGYDKARKAAARRAADRNAARKRGEMGGRMERETYTLSLIHI